VASEAQIPGGEGWEGPRGPGRSPGFTWRRLLWSLLCPSRGNRVVPTPPGAVLGVLCAGLTAAAYGSASNILFITVALLLTSLVLGGLLGWLNLRGLRWRLRPPRALRAGQDAVVPLELRHAGRFLPVRCVGFELAARAVPAGGAGASDLPARLRLAPSGETPVTGRVALPGRLDPGAGAEVAWDVRPARRGRLRIELRRVVSVFPFGLLRRELSPSLAVETIVWPAPAEPRLVGTGFARRRPEGRPRPRAGVGSDLLALRAYRPGDSPRQVHWKASARTGSLLVRQPAAEAAEGYALRVCTEAARWPRPAQFELLLSVAAALAEDFYRRGRLQSFALGTGPAFAVRRLSDLERALDCLALAEPGPPMPAAAGGREIVTFTPEGARGVVAWAGRERLAVL
jgi:uncharacterized protein (DUF58 family)